jgi:hypothetical protein
VLTKALSKTKTSGFFKQNQAQLGSNEFGSRKKSQGAEKGMNFNKTTGAGGFASQMQQRSLTQSPARAVIAPMKPIKAANK